VRVQCVKSVLVCMQCVVQNETQSHSALYTVPAYFVKSILVCMQCVVQNGTLSHYALYTA
jgi:hypothetical protein